LLEGMENIAPGAKNYFASLLAEADLSKEMNLLDRNSENRNLEDNQKAVELAVMMNTNMDLVTRAIHYLPSHGKAEIVSAIAQSIRLTA
jgi:hypothetical protein